MMTLITYTHNRAEFLLYLRIGGDTRECRVVCQSDQPDEGKWLVMTLTDEATNTSIRPDFVLTYDNKRRILRALDEIVP